MCGLFYLRPGQLLQRLPFLCFLQHFLKQPLQAKKQFSPLNDSGSVGKRFTEKLSVCCSIILQK